MTIMGTTWCTSLQDIMKSRLAEHSYDEHATEEGHYSGGLPVATSWSEKYDLPAFPLDICSA